MATSATHRRAWRLPRRPISPVVAMVIICALSLGVRLAFITQPCHSPCRSAQQRVLIFDEDYYVNAARVIAGVRPPAGAPYAKAPSGDDPNAEHPQLAKLMMAGLIEWLGDGPVAWRLPSILLGTLCLLGMYALVRAAGGSEWVACAAAALMAADNLLLVHSRIGTLDVPALTGMVWGVALYLRGRPLWAGAVIALGSCAKLVAPYAGFAVIVLEILGWALTRQDLRARVRRLLVCGVAFAVVLVAVLGALDAIAPPYDDAAGKPVRGGPIAHLEHMFSYAAHQKSPHGPQGIASYPWQWLVDSGYITYLNVNPSEPASGLFAVHPPVHFLGAINPPILLVGLVALLLTLGTVGEGILAAWTDRGPPGAEAAADVRRRGSVRIPAGAEAAADLRLFSVGLAWFLGTYVPFVLFSAIDDRTSYLYYMVVVMPGFYVMAAALGARMAAYRWVFVVWVTAVVVAAVLMYPFTPLP